MNRTRSALVPKDWYNAERVKQPGSVVLQQWLAQRKSVGATLGPTSTSFSATDVAMLERIFGRSSYTNRAITDEFALAVSTWWRCIQLRAQTVGSLPWSVYEQVGPNEAKEVPDHPLADVLVHSPNADMDRMQFREALEANLANRGNAYSLKETRRDGSVSALYPFSSAIVTPRRKQGTQEWEYVVADGSEREIYPSEKIWHIRTFSFTGRMGLDPRVYARHALALAGAAEEFGARFFSNGARVSGVVKIPQWLDDEQRPKAKKNIEEFWSGLDNAHKLQLLEGGMEYESVSAPPGEAQHDELRSFQVPDICRFHGVPPHLVFDLRHGSYNNVETLANEWVTFGLMPDLVRIELAAQKQLLPAAERRRIFVRFNFEGLLRANSLERSQFYTAMVQNGIFSRNEVREKENLNRIDEAGMDDRTVQTNLALIQFLEAMVKAGAANGRGDDQGAAKGFKPPPPPQMPPVNVALPSSLRIDGLDELVKQMQASQKVAPELLAAIEGVRKVLAMPRKAVFDKDGNPLGTVAVDAIEGAA